MWKGGERQDSRDAPQRPSPPPPAHDRGNKVDKPTAALLNCRAAVSLHCLLCSSNGKQGEITRSAKLASACTSEKRQDRHSPSSLPTEGQRDIQPRGARARWSPERPRHGRYDGRYPGSNIYIIYNIYIYIYPCIYIQGFAIMIESQRLMQEYWDLQLYRKQIPQSRYTGRYDTFNTTSVQQVTQ